MRLRILFALTAITFLGACTARWSTIKANEKGISWEVTVRDDYRYEMLDEAKQRAAAHCKSYGKAASNVEFIVRGHFYKYYPGVNVGDRVETVGTVTAACYSALEKARS